MNQNHCTQEECRYAETENGIRCKELNQQTSDQITSGTSLVPARPVANKLQLAGYDMDKNVITRIETNKRYVSDLELKAIAEIFQVSYVYLIAGWRSRRDRQRTGKKESGQDALFSLGFTFTINQPPNFFCLIFNAFPTVAIPIL